MCLQKIKIRLENKLPYGKYEANHKWSPKTKTVGNFLKFIWQMSGFLINKKNPYESVKQKSKGN